MPYGPVRSSSTEHSSNERIPRLIRTPRLSSFGDSRWCIGRTPTSYQTNASADFTITNGVLRSDNVRIEGKIFSVRMKGSYDAVRDDLDFKVQVQFFKQNSIVGKLLRPLTWAFSELLLDFRLTGPLDDPKWSYENIVKKMMEVGK